MSTAPNDSPTFKSVLKYVITIVCFILAVIVIVATSMNIKYASQGNVLGKTFGACVVIFCKYLFAFALIMVGVSELISSDTILIGGWDVKHDGYRIIKPERPEIELTPVQHYFNITAQISVWIIVLICAFFVSEFRRGQLHKD